jgi:hypothetical protein
MPTFCRHNRFIERCPVCSREAKEHDAAAHAAAPARPRSRAAGGARAPRGGAAGLRVRREIRAADDGYSCTLVPGLRASADAERLALELEFAAWRLLTLASDPPGLYGEVRELAARDLEAATWQAFLLVYVSPAEGDDPFAAIAALLAQTPALPLDGPLPDLEGIELGPRSSHDPARGSATIDSYVQWTQRNGGQVAAFTGDPGWTPERRFERVLERLALPGFGRAGRYDLLVVLGRLGMYPLEASALAFGGQRGLAADDAVTQAAKRVFGIADPLLLERRARRLAQAARVPIEALDLALANWAAPVRATLGMPAPAQAWGRDDAVRAALAL